MLTIFYECHIFRLFSHFQHFSQHLFHAMFFCHKGKSIYALPQREVSLLIMIKKILFYIFKKLTLSWRSHYHTETSPLICRANQWTGLYMITNSVIKKLNMQNFSFLINPFHATDIKRKRKGTFKQIKAGLSPSIFLLASMITLQKWWKMLKSSSFHLFIFIISS